MGLAPRLGNYSELKTYAAAIFDAHITGSSIYQNTTPTSDYDYIVVFEDNVLPRVDTSHLKMNGSNAIDKRFIVLEEGLINATLISYYDWRVCLLQHHHECLEVLFTDRNLYLFESEKIRRLHDSFVVDKDLLRRTAAWESKRRFTRAVFPARDQMRRGKKDLVHALRYLMFAMQIFEHGRIVDFTCANGLYKQIVLNTEHVQTEEAFKALMVELEPKRSELSHAIGDARQSRRFYGRTDTERNFLYEAMKKRFLANKLDFSKFERSALPNGCVESPFAPFDQWMVDKANKGIHSLHDLDVEATWLRDEKSPELLILFHQRMIQDVTHPFTRMIANGVVLQQEVQPNSSDEGEEKRSTYKILSFGMPYMFASKPLPSNEREVWNNRLALPNASERFIAEEHIDGTHLSLFVRNGKWELASRVEPSSPAMTLSFIPVNNVNYEISLSDAFWKVWNDKKYSLPDIEVHGHLCFTFVLVYFDHRHLVCYEYEDALLVHARDMETGKVVDHRSFAAARQWNVPRLFGTSSSSSNSHLLPSSLESFESIVFDENPLYNKGYILKSVAPKVDEISNEGSVKMSLSAGEASVGGNSRTTDLIDPSWHAVSIKNPIYVSMRYGTDFSNIGQLNMRVEVDRKMLVDMTIFGTDRRFLDFYPEWIATFDKIRNPYREFCKIIDIKSRPLLNAPRPEMANDVKDFEYRHAVYHLYHYHIARWSDFAGLMPSKSQFVTKPWRLFLRKTHRELFNWLTREDNDESDDPASESTSMDS